MSWGKHFIEWIENDIAFVSCVFTWQLPEVYQRCIWLRQEGYRIYAGGPAVSLMPEYLADVAEIGGQINALPRHNPNATFTSRGCPRNCSFCAVPRIEGDLVELDGWEPKPIVCDNNLLACSRCHFDKVIDSLKGIKGVDFNQGLDARLLTDYHIERLRELNLSHIRLAWDHTNLESLVQSAISRLADAGLSKGKINVYVLIGFDDSPEDALYRLETLRNIGIRPFCQRYQPLNSLRRNSYVAPNWTERQLRDFCRFWNKQIYFRSVSFSDYIQAEGKTKTLFQNKRRLQEALVRCSLASIAGGNFQSDMLRKNGA